MMIAMKREKVRRCWNTRTTAAPNQRAAVTKKRPMDNGGESI